MYLHVKSNFIRAVKAILYSKMLLKIDFLAVCFTIPSEGIISHFNTCNFTYQSFISSVPTASALLANLIKWP